MVCFLWLLINPISCVLGTQIYILNGTDPEGQPVRYGLAFDPGSKEYFRVDPKSGVVTLVEELNREAQDEIEVLVSISDGLNKVVEKVRVFVMDANDEQPVFQNMPSIVDVPESTASGSSIYKVHAVDKDTGSGGSVTYFLQSNDPNSKFAIDRHSGVLRIKPGQNLDYERSRTHFITVVAKDGGGNHNGRVQVMSSSATLTINVIDSQDTPPIFVGTPYFGYVYEVSSPGSEIFTVFAKDGDMENPNLIVYSIQNGRFLNIIFPCCQASEVNSEGDLMDSSVTTVTIRVVDLNNHPPTFYGEDGPRNVFEMTMYEHPPEGEILRGLKITVNDSDQGANAKFNLRLVGPGRMLKVVPQTVLNEAQVTILVEDSAAIDYEKSQTLIFKATDPDSGLWGVVKYSIYGSGSDLFLIQSDSGIIYTQPWASLDAEVKSKYNFYVKAEDTEGKYSLAEVFVTVLDLNDHPPEFSNDSLEKTMIIGAPVKIEAVDDDAEEPNNVIEYSIMKTEPDNIFDINAQTGEIKLKSYIKSMDIVQNITNQRDCTWSVVVQARDRGSPSFSTTTIVKIDITETQLRGPFAYLFMQSRENPMQILGLFAGVIMVMVTVTVLISTVLFLRNKKSNKILPSRRIIRRRAKHRKQWNFQNPFKPQNNGENFMMKETDVPTAENINCNNNSVGSRWSPPTPPRAPMPPPLPGYSRPGDRSWAVPTVSAAVASKSNRRPCKHKQENPINTALVSELKLRLEQKRMTNRY
uniref:Cadherin-related family member 1-like n=1 Tax=Astyanax mexicanus TaxID=7994 RepID=A0A8B9LIZ0_ASTMX